MENPSAVVAVIDLGTNTFHLLIGKRQDGQIHELFQLQLPVKIGQNGIHKGIISKEAWERAMKALSIFKEHIEAFKAERLLATGTSAIRNAANGEAFLQEIKSRYGFEIQKIDGNQEAELIYKGVSKSFPFPDEPLWVMDIGGGSVEFVLGQREAILFRQSFEIGAARLIERFGLSDPITPTERKDMEQYFEEVLKPVWAVQEKYKANWVVGSAGSFDTLREVLEFDLGSAAENFSAHAHRFSKVQLRIYSGFIINSTIAERTQMKGLVPFRVDMIVAASLLMNYVLTRLDSKQLIASHYALKEGLLLSI